MQCNVHTASLAQVSFKQYILRQKDSVAVYADTLLKGVLDVRSGLVTDLSLKGWKIALDTPKCKVHTASLAQARLSDRQPCLLHLRHSNTLQHLLIQRNAHTASVQAQQQPQFRVWGITSHGNMCWLSTA